MAYSVTAPMVAISVPIGARTSQVRFLEQGSLLPEGVEDAQIAHLLSMGMIAEAEQDAELAEPAVDAMTVEQLKAYLTERGIPFEGVTLKADLLALAQQ